MADETVSFVIPIERQETIHSAPHDYLIRGRHSRVPFPFETLAEILKVRTRGEELHSGLRPGGADAGENGRLRILVVPRLAKNHREESISQSRLTEFVSLRPEDLFCASLRPTVRDHLFPALGVEVDGERTGAKYARGVRAVVS